MKARKKPVVIEAITFDEFVQYGKEHTDNIVNGMPWSFEYKGHPVTHVNDKCYLIPTLEGDHNFTPADVLITGVAGEIYPCKIDIFKATYDPAEENMTFGAAIEAAKSGRKIARLGWNGKGMYVIYRTGYPEGIPCNKNTADAVGIPEGTLFKVRPYLQMKCVDDTFQMWLASQSDILADDWYIVE